MGIKRWTLNCEIFIRSWSSIEVPECETFIHVWYVTYLVWKTFVRSKQHAETLQSGICRHIHQYLVSMPLSLGRSGDGRSESLNNLQTWSQSCHLRFAAQRYLVPVHDIGLRILDMLTQSNSIRLSLHCSAATVDRACSRQLLRLILLSAGRRLKVVVGVCTFFFCGELSAPGPRAASYG